MKPSLQARQRASLILQVRSGQLTATQAAQLLGVSRKTYYQWERRALQGMMHQLDRRPAGRPTKPHDREKVALQQQVRRLETKLSTAKKLAELRRILRELDRPTRKKRPNSSTK
jgi:transposase